MVENLYSFLATVGFTHPLHPMLTHVPMGMIIGMVVFSLLGLIWKNNNLTETAFHCCVLALLAVGPVIGAGILDWLHLQQGEWNKYIIVKMILGTLLYHSSGSGGHHEEKRGKPGEDAAFLSSLPCLCRRLGLFRGELVYG